MLTLRSMIQPSNVQVKLQPLFDDLQTGINEVSKQLSDSEKPYAVLPFSPERSRAKDVAGTDSQLVLRTLLNTSVKTPSLSSLRPRGELSIGTFNGRPAC